MLSLNSVFVHQCSFIGRYVYRFIIFIASVITLRDNPLRLIVMFHKGLFYHIIDCYVSYIRLYESGNFSKCHKLLIGCS